MENKRKSVSLAEKFIVVQKNKILIALCACLLIAGFLIFVFLVHKDADCSRNNSFLTCEQKKAAVSYAYNLFDTGFPLKNIEIPSEIKNITADYDKLFITFSKNGKEICSRGGSSMDTGEKRFPEDIFLAVEKCTEQIKLKNDIPVEQMASFSIEFEFLYGEQDVSGKNIDELKKDIQLGIDALKMKTKKETVYIKSSTPIERRYSLGRTINKMCKTLDMEEGCSLEKGVSLYRYNSFSFKGDEKQNISDLYRNSDFLDISDIHQSLIKKSIAGGHSWYKNNTNQETGLLNYVYYPESDVYPNQESHGRSIAAIWAMGELDDFLNRDDLKYSAQKSLDYYLNFSIIKNGARYVKIESDSKLIYGAFLIMALLKQEDYPNRDVIIKELANSVLNEQRPNGSFNLDFEKEIAEYDKGVDYYPGETLLSLMMLYRETGEQKYIEAVKNAVPYYIDYWRSHKNTAFIPWHTQAYKLLFEETGDKNLVNFVFEMSDWLIDNYQKFESPYLDYVGGFGNNPSNSSASYLEGLADAYYLAKKVGDRDHIEKYEKSCKYATRFVMQTQVIEGDEDTFYFPNFTKTIGGFKQSPLNISQRNDYTQHATLALIKVYKNKLFNLFSF